MHKGVDFIKVCMEMAWNIMIRPTILFGKINKYEGCRTGALVTLSKQSISMNKIFDNSHHKHVGSPTKSLCSDHKLRLKIWLSQVRLFGNIKESNYNNKARWDCLLGTMAIYNACQFGNITHNSATSLFGETSLLGNINTGQSAVPQ